MSMKQWLRILAASLVGLAAGCGPASDEDVGTITQTLNVPGLVPVPCGRCNTTSPLRPICNGVSNDSTLRTFWDANQVKLMVADAWAQCTMAIPQSTQSTFRDDYLQLVSSKMSPIVAVSQGSAANVAQAWFAYRGGTNNCNLGGDGQPIPYPLEQLDSLSLDLSSVMNGHSLGELVTPLVNSCIAQVLRQQAPGGIGGPALLLAAEEQMELLNVIRERAQMAAVQFALLAAMNNEKLEVGTLDAGVPYLREWFFNASPAELRTMGLEFSISIQLLIATTEELADLVARSRSARLPYSGLSEAGTEADRLWGSGSWQQRLGTLLYGGNFIDATSTGQLGGRFTASDFPYVRANITEPQVFELLRLARSVDAVVLPTEDVTREIVGGHAPIVGPITVSGPCPEVVADGSLLYEQTQRGLQRAACLRQHGSDATFDEISGSCNGEPGLDLLSQHGILLEHADKLTQHLGELIGPTVGGAFCSRVLPRYGAQNVTGEVTLESDGTLRLSSDFGFKPRQLENIAGLFGYGAPFLADTWDHGIGLAGQGFSSGISTVGGTVLPSGFSSTLKRQMGAVSALTYVRSVIERIRDSSTTEYSRVRELMLGVPGEDNLVSLISAAIGEDGVTVRRQRRRCDCVNDTAPAFWSACVSIAGCQSGVPTSNWDIQVRANEFDLVTAPPQEGSESVWAVVLPGGFAEHFLAAADQTNLLGQTAADILGQAFGAGRFASLEYDPVGSTWRGVFESNTLWPSGFSGSSSTRFIVAGYRGSSPASELTNLTPEELASRVRLLVSNIPFLHHTQGGFPAQASYTATGGSLGVFAKRQFSPSKWNATRPAYDGFGLPEGWVPPFSAELYGAEPGVSTVSHFLRSAFDMGKDASDAVHVAMSNLLEQQIDVTQQRITEEQKEATLAASAERAMQGLREEQATLCGLDNVRCSLEPPQEMRLDPAWYPALGGTIPKDGCAEFVSLAIETLDRVPNDPLITLPELALGTTYLQAKLVLEAFNVNTDKITSAVTNAFDKALEAIGFDFGRDNFDSENEAMEAAQRDAELAIQDMRCFAEQMIGDFMNVRPAVAGPVLPHLLQPTAPTFGEFSGGELQNAFIEQWRAIKEPNERFDTLLKTVDAVAARIDAANTVVATAGGRVRRECAHSAFDRAFKAGFSGGFLSITWSPGPLHAQQQRCDDAMDAFAPTLKQATAENKGALMAVSTATQGLTSAQAAIAQSGANIERIVSRAKLAKERIELEHQLDQMLATVGAQNVRKTSFGLYRRYRDHDLWRAKALLESARRNALIARRAIEAQFVVDLSSLAADEAFVVAPRSWADEIYQYDLSLPAAVGLVLSPDGTDAIAANKVEDYVRNLRAFLDGYAVTRPSAIARDEVDVITLPGIGPGLPFLVDENAPEGATVFPEQGAWQVHCAESRRWVPLEPGTQNVAAVCDGETADRVKLLFDLDPWGQLNSSPLNQPFERRYNGRWTRLAVNLVGTGVLDCSAAFDALECYSRGHVRYNLRHTGRPWVTDFFGNWRTLLLPTGVIEGGKAVALERWLEPLVDGWETSYISAVRRTEFEFRPLGGQYQLEIALRPEIRPENIQRVQLLVGSEYWVVQE